MLTENKLQKEVWMACQFLVQQRLDSGPFGNVSARIPNTNTYWHNPVGIPFRQLEVDDILLVDTNGNVLKGSHKPHPGEFIHREIYKMRPDVVAVVHTHSPNTVFQSLLGKIIEPYTQLGCAFFGDQGLYLGFTGPVRDANEGHEIAKALGKKSTVIAKNHGQFAVSTNNIRAALWDMILLEWASQIHVEAVKMGLPTAGNVPDSDLEKSRREVRERQYESMWQSFVKELTTL